MKQLAALLLVLLFTGRGLAADPPPLEKAAALRLLQFREWTEVTILAVRQGVDSKGAAAPIYATVLGLGTWHGEHRAICETIIYDADLNWHILEIGNKSARIWNRDGCREIRPWSTW